MTIGVWSIKLAFIPDTFQIMDVSMSYLNLFHQNLIKNKKKFVNSLRPNDAYMRQYTNNHWFRQWLVAWPAPSHYLNQCWNIVIWAHRDKLQWTLNRNSCIFIQQNAFENVVWKMVAILCRPRWVKRRWAWECLQTGRLLSTRTQT